MTNLNQFTDAVQRTGCGDVIVMSGSGKPALKNDPAACPAANDTLYKAATLAAALLLLAGAAAA